MGGAAVTEEIVPGFKFSRASYLLSLLRPVVVKELELKVCYSHAMYSTYHVSSLQKHGFKVYLRDPSSYTPLHGTKDYLLLSSDAEENRREISKFSKQDAEVCKHTDNIYHFSVRLYNYSHIWNMRNG